MTTQILIAIAIMLAFSYIMQPKKKKTKKKQKNNKKLQLTKNDSVLQEQIEETYPYKDKPLLTKNEYIFYIELQKLAKEMHWIICPKVGIKDIFQVTDKENYMHYFGRIAQKHIDFIICREDLTPLYAIELDDKSHNSEKRQESDKFKNKIFEKSRIELIRIKACSEYSKEYIIRNILNKSNREQPEKKSSTESTKENVEFSTLKDDKSKDIHSS